jgi:HPt (histidine-containing phosphotransfer) domain-containing protein
VAARKISEASAPKPVCTPIQSSSQALCVLPELEGFDLVSALKRLGGRTETLRKALVAADKPFSQALDDLRSALANQDWVTMQRVVHTLRGSGGTLGAFDVVRIAAQWEDELKMCDRRYAEKNLSDMTQAMHIIFVSLKRLQELCPA